MTCVNNSSCPFTILFVREAFIQEQVKTIWQHNAQ